MLHVVMPRKGIAYPVDDAWRRRVIERLREMGWTNARLAREARCPRSLLTELLRLDDRGARRHQTPYLPEIHKALGWPEPQVAAAPVVIPELEHVYGLLDERGRERVLASAREELARLLGKPETGQAKGYIKKS